MPRPAFGNARGPGPHGPGRGLVLAGLIVPAVLLLLRERENHGYALRDELEASELMANVDFGNLYRTLRRLEMMGLVTSRWDREGEGPGRRVYAITTEGAHYLENVSRDLMDVQHVLTRFFKRYRQEGER